MFNINGETWIVLFVSPIHPSLRRSDGTFAWGVCNDLDKTIYIADHLSPEDSKKVLCHEITHSAMFSYNIYLDIEQEELLANLMATFGEEIIDLTDILFFKLKEKWENR